jgi:hypothetical protein
MKFLFIGFFLLCSLSAVSQVKVSGMVADSLSFKGLPNVHIKIKSKSGGTVTDEKGFFSISTAPFDTLLFSTIGYVTLPFPVILDEEDVIILLREDVTYLQAVIVMGKPILSPLIRPKKEYTYHRAAPSKLVSGSGIAFDYFSREQREKRKLQKLITANERVLAYHQVITDPEFKDEVTSKYKLTEEEYYNAVLSFNQTRINTIEYRKKEEVITILNQYFCSLSKACP